MGLFGKVAAFAAGVLGGIGIIAIGNKIAENTRESAERERLEKERQSTPCYFTNGISQNEFYSMVHNVTKHIKRLIVSVDGPIIYGTVRSQSGISTWNFKLDFNDFGDITGNYWIWRENRDSDIPDNIAKQIQTQIQAYFAEN